MPSYCKLKQNGFVTFKRHLFNGHMDQRSQILQDNFDYTLFSWSKQKGISPLAISHAEGVYLYDYDGKRYLDFSSGLMNVNICEG